MTATLAPPAHTPARRPRGGAGGVARPGKAAERDFNVLYDQAARGSVEHWNLPDAMHTHAIREQRAVYERRVVGFLNNALR